MAKLTDRADSSPHPWFNSSSSKTGNVKKDIQKAHGIPWKCSSGFKVPINFIIKKHV